MRIYSRVLSATQISALSEQTTPREDYTAWAARTMASRPTGDRVEGADPDLDGLSNFGEFAYSLDPLKAQALTRGVGGLLRFTFRRRLNGGDIGYTILIFANLKTWTPRTPERERDDHDRERICRDAFESAVDRSDIAPRGRTSTRKHARRRADIYQIPFSH